MSWHFHCDECHKQGPTREVRVSRQGAAAWLCSPCGVKQVYRWVRLGMTGIIAPADVWSAVRTLEAERAPVETSDDAWLSKHQVERLLRREAEATAARLGHKLGTWGSWLNICLRCGEVVRVTPREPGPSISGEVVAMACPGKPRGIGAMLIG